MSRVPSYYATPNRLKSEAQMNALLAQRTKKVIASGPAGQEAGGVLGYPPAGKTPSINAEAEHRETSVREALSQPLGTSAPLNGSGVAQPVAEHGVDKSRLPGADSAAVAALIWLAPVKDPTTGHYTVKDTLGRFTVVAERTSGGKGWQYLAFKGSAVLAPVCSTAECAKAHCQADMEKSS